MNLILKKIPFIFLFFIAAISSFMYAKVESDCPCYTEYVQRVINEFAKEMEKEHGIVCYGSGGSMPYDVRQIDVRFSSYRRAEVADARKDLMMVMNKLLDKINGNEQLRPYLREYPFKSNMLGIAIAYYHKVQGNGEEWVEPYRDGSVSLVSFGYGKVRYSGSDSNDDLFKILEETYESTLENLKDKGS